jgi:hypothetical protein
VGSLSPPPQKEPPAGPRVALRRRLRAIGGVELWLVELPKTQGQRIPTILYLVRRDGAVATFNRPHEAWHYFQQRTNAPDRDTRPEPPPIDEAFLQRPPQKRKPVRRRSSSPK